MLTDYLLTSWDTRNCGIETTRNLFGHREPHHHTCNRGHLRNFGLFSEQRKAGNWRIVRKQQKQSNRQIILMLIKQLLATRLYEWGSEDADRSMLQTK